MIVYFPGGHLESANGIHGAVRFVSRPLHRGHVMGRQFGHPSLHCAWVGRYPLLLSQSTKKVLLEGIEIRINTHTR